MPPITFTPGSPNWLTLAAPDLAAAAEFYRTVLGWRFDPATGLFALDGRAVAGAARPGAEAPTWHVHFHTPDADATSEAVVRAGGTVRTAPAEVPGLGRTAHFADPSGATFAVLQPVGRAGFDAVATPGALNRTELYTTDAASARTFYQAVFGWQLTEKPFPGLLYLGFAPAEESHPADRGGIMQLPQANLDAGSTPEWHPYFTVTDCDAALAAAAEGGAVVLIPAMDVPTVGRMGMFVDPQGAVLAVLQP
ncbi:VOC family protein [Kitasatospora sp. NPDC002227]|uniref:VOC family protein n=1 Tax=Kitasatospora sp. NPDC002227 TaxID=3154773 RepID=UPI0033193CBC